MARTRNYSSYSVVLLIFFLLLNKKEQQKVLLLSNSLPVYFYKKLLNLHKQQFCTPFSNSGCVKSDTPMIDQVYRLFSSRWREERQIAFAARNIPNFLPAGHIPSATGWALGQPKRACSTKTRL